MGDARSAFPDDADRDLVTTYQPDVVVEMLGIQRPRVPPGHPGAGRGLHAAFVADAHAADPAVDVVLARVPKPWLPAAVAYNPRLDTVAADLDTPAGRVVVARSDEGLDRSQDTWDDAHLDAWGEVKVAAAVADSLAAIGIGPLADRPLVLPPRGPRLASTLAVAAGNRSALLTWTRSPGATSTRVLIRDRTAGGPWRRLAELPWQVTSWRARGLSNGHDLRFTVLPVKGFWAAAPDVESNAVAVEPRPARPGRVREVSIDPRRTALRVTWGRAPWADSYVVWWRRASGRHGWTREPVRRPHTLLRGLRPGVRYLVAVQPVGRAAAGPRTRPQAAVTGPEGVSPH